MLFLIYIFLIVFIYFKKNDKRSWILVAAILTILSITSFTYADLDNYNNLFNYYSLSSTKITYSTTNVLWALLCKMFYLFGFNYRGMVVGLIWLNTYMMHKSLKNFSCNENIVFSCFMIFPAIIQLVQIKFFTATTIILFGYSFLVRNKRKSLAIYIICLIAAFFIHNSSVLFIIFILLNKQKINIKNILFFSLLMTLIFSFNINRISNIARLFISEQQFNRYFVQTITPSSFKWILMIFVVWFLCYIIAYVTKKINVGFNIILEKNLSSIALLLITVPLLLIDRNMHRFIEFGYMLMFISLASVTNLKEKTKNNFYIKVITLIVLLISMTIYTPYNSVLKPLFKYDKIVSIRR